MSSVIVKPISYKTTFEKYDTDYEEHVTECLKRVMEESGYRTESDANFRVISVDNCPIRGTSNIFVIVTVEYSGRYIKKYKVPKEILYEPEIG